MVNKIIAAVDKFDGKMGRTTAPIGTPNHNNDQPKLYFSSAKRHKNHET